MTMKHLFVFPFPLPIFLLSSVFPSTLKPHSTTPQTSSRAMPPPLSISSAWGLANTPGVCRAFSPQERGCEQSWQARGAGEGDAPLPSPRSPQGRRPRLRRLLALPLPGALIN